MGTGTTRWQIIFFSFQMRQTMSKSVEAFRRHLLSTGLSCPTQAWHRPTLIPDLPQPLLRRHTTVVSPASLKAADAIQLLILVGGFEQNEAAAVDIRQYICRTASVQLTGGCRVQTPNQMAHCYSRHTARFHWG